MEIGEAVKNIQLEQVRQAKKALPNSRMCPIIKMNSLTL